MGVGMKYTGMDLVIEIDETMGGEACDNCSLAIRCHQTMTFPAAFDCRLNTPQQFTQYCPDIDSKIQDFAKNTYEDVLADEGFAPIHLTYTKEVDLCQQRQQ